MLTSTELPSIFTFPFHTNRLTYCSVSLRTVIAKFFSLIYLSYLFRATSSLHYDLFHNQEESAHHVAGVHQSHLPASVSECGLPVTIHYLFVALEFNSMAKEDNLSFATLVAAWGRSSEIEAPLGINSDTSSLVNLKSKSCQRHQKQEALLFHLEFTHFFLDQKFISALYQ